MSKLVSVIFTVLCLSCVSAARPPLPAAGDVVFNNFANIKQSTLPNNNATAFIRNPESALKSGGNMGAFGTASNFVGLQGNFKVPSLPQTYSQQSVFLWYGVQFSGGDYGVLQPVLMYGPVCCAKGGVGAGSDPNYDANPYWYWSSQYVYPDGTGSYQCDCPSSPRRAEPGHTISTHIYLGTDGTWTTYAKNEDTGEEDWVTVAHPKMDDSLSWSALTPYPLIIQETYNVNSVDKLPGDAAWSITATTDGRDPGWSSNSGNVHCSGSQCSFNLQGL